MEQSSNISSRTNAYGLGYPLLLGWVRVSVYKLQNEHGNRRRARNHFANRFACIRDRRESTVISDGGIVFSFLVMSRAVAYRFLESFWILVVEFGFLDYALPAIPDLSRAVHANSTAVP